MRLQELGQVTTQEKEGTFSGSSKVVHFHTDAKALYLEAAISFTDTLQPSLQFPNTLRTGFQQMYYLGAMTLWEIKSQGQMHYIGQWSALLLEGHYYLIAFVHKDLNRWFQSPLKKH